MQLSIKKNNQIKNWAGNSLVVQWLGFHPFTAKGPGLIPVQGTKILQAKLHSQKKDRRPKQTFLQRRHTDGQKAHEKMLNIINH